MGCRSSMEVEREKILEYLEEMKENLDTPAHFFNKVHEDLYDALEYDYTIPPAIILKEYSEKMWEYSTIAKTAYSRNLFEMYAIITDILLESYLGELFIWEDLM